jgi:hypothetical protein
MGFSSFKYSLFICMGYVIQIPKYSSVVTFQYYPLYSCIVQIFVIVSQQICFQFGIRKWLSNFPNFSTWKFCSKYVQSMTQYY